MTKLLLVISVLNTIALIVLAGAVIRISAEITKIKTDRLIEKLKANILGMSRQH